MWWKYTNCLKISHCSVGKYRGLNSAVSSQIDNAAVSFLKIGVIISLSHPNCLHCTPWASVEGCWRVVSLSGRTACWMGFLHTLRSETIVADKRRIGIKQPVKSGHILYEGLCKLRKECFTWNKRCILF